jgi:hypothetical protein
MYLPNNIFMKPLYTFTLCFLAFYGPVSAANAAPSDSSLRAKSVDEDLILDEGPSSVLPKDKKPAVSSPVVDSPAPAKNAVTPAPKGQTAPPAAAKAVSQVKDTAKKIVDEDLILDGGEEDLLGQTKKTPLITTGVNANTAAAKTTDSVAAKTSADSIGVVTDQNQKTSAATLPNGKAAAQEKPPAPKAAAKIENARSINFAANLKEYRSPKLAMLMSLCVPGSGQVYAKSNLWAAGFLLVEAAIIGTGVVYSSQSKAKKAKAHGFADTAYSADKFKNYTDSLHNDLNGFGDKGDTIYSSIFFDSSDVQFLKEANKSPGNRNSSFYDNISGESSPFVRGWKDVTPSFSSSGFPPVSGDGIYRYVSADSNYLVYRYSNKANVSFGFSDYQLHYISILDESRKLANYSRTAFVTLLINHLASAVMAGIEAKNHNDALLGMDESFWRHIDIEQQFVNTGSETVAGYSVGVRF